MNDNNSPISLTANGQPKAKPSDTTPTAFRQSLPPLPARPPVAIKQASGPIDAADTTPWLDTVHHGDSTQVLRRLPDAFADMVLTDPPYLVSYRDRGGRTVPNDDNTRWMYPVFSELFRVMKPNTYCVSFYGWSHAERFLSIWKECGFKPVGHFVWVKRYTSCTRHTQMRHEQAYLLAKGNPVAPKCPPPDVMDWRYTGNRLHPTQKPVESLMPLVQAYCRPSGVVLDPFGGSGSTGIAAAQLKRHFLLIEKDEGFYKVAHERLAKMTPQNRQTAV